MIESTMYNVKNPIKLVVHGWFGNTKEKESVCTYTFNGEQGQTDKYRPPGCKIG